MRRQLNLLVLAVTLLLVVAFVVPLGLLVQRQADQRARLVAEREAQTVAAVIVRSVVDGEAGTSVEALSTVIGTLPPGVAVITSAGSIGEVDPVDDLVEVARDRRQAQSAYTERGWELALPVITRTDTIVVYAFVPESDLNHGVTRAWLLLAALGLGLMAASLLLADRLARTVVGPSRRLAEAALLLGSGDLDTRVEKEGPPELRTVAAVFNTLAQRLRELLAAEREAVADLSHRLRTPLTAVRLQAEQLSGEERTVMLGHVDRLQGAVDDLIREARRRPTEGEPRCDVGRTVGERVDYWEVLAEEQGRALDVSIDDTPAVPLPESEVAAALDALIGNVFTHTEPGVGFRVAVETIDQGVKVTIADGGPGVPPGVDPSIRGASGGGSTGLGLDIARRLAARSGGHLSVENGPQGGAVVEMVLGTRGGGGR